MLLFTAFPARINNILVLGLFFFPIIVVTAVLPFVTNNAQTCIDVISRFLLSYLL